MAIDYRSYDMRNLFFIRDVARLWCEIEEITPANRHMVGSMLCAIREAVSTGELRCDHSLNAALTSPPNWNEPAFTREELRRWALSKGQKPKLLFPEMRDQEPTLAVSDVAAIVAEAPIHANQKRIAAWKAEAQMIWNEHPEYTQGQVAAMICANMLANQKGSFSEKAVIRAIAAFDPRENRVGRRKKQLTDS